MPVCCQCNTSGRCKNCSSKKSGKPCFDCLHVRQGHCEMTTPCQTLLSLPLRPTAWESPNMATTHPSSLPHEEGPEQGSELSNTSLLDDNLHTLPPYPQIHEPSFTWGNVDGATLTHAITCCYNEVVHWKRNLFNVPSGKAVNSFKNVTYPLKKLILTEKKKKKKQ